MPPDAESFEPRLKLAIEPLLAAGGLAVCGLVSHRGLPWVLLGAGGLVLAAAAIGRSLGRAVHPAALLGLSRVSAWTGLLSILGVLVGAGAAMLHRQGMGISVWPVPGIGDFALMAGVIGATEELVYRGWLQGSLRQWGWPAAVLCSALAHAAYKTALFAWPSGSMVTDHGAIVLWTVAGGIVLGLLRQISGSLIPAMVAHVVFDLIVYGSMNQAPWWVWT